MSRRNDRSDTPKHLWPSGRCSTASREAQDRFMEGRLGGALQEGRITVVPTVTWVDLVSYNQLQGAAAS
jgi:hypothetical protein